MRSKKLLFYLFGILMLSISPWRAEAQDRFYLLVHSNNYTVSGTESEIPAKYKMTKNENRNVWSIDIDADDITFFNNGECSFQFQHFWTDNSVVKKTIIRLLLVNQTKLLLLAQNMVWHGPRGVRMVNGHFQARRENTTPLQWIGLMEIKSML